MSVMKSVLSCLSILALVAIIVPVQAADTGGDVDVQPVEPGAYQAVPFFETEGATCIADCGDGTGWQCTGPSVSCTDGEGCTATDGEIELSGKC